MITLDFIRHNMTYPYLTCLLIYSTCHHFRDILCASSIICIHSVTVGHWLSCPSLLLPYINMSSILCSMQILNLRRRSNFLACTWASVALFSPDKITGSKEITFHTLDLTEHAWCELNPGISLVVLWLICCRLWICLVSRSHFSFEAIITPHKWIPRTSETSAEVVVKQNVFKALTHYRSEAAPEAPGTGLRRYLRHWQRWMWLSGKCNPLGI